MIRNCIIAITCIALVLFAFRSCTDTSNENAEQWRRLAKESWQASQRLKQKALENEFEANELAIIVENLKGENNLLKSKIKAVQKQKQSEIEKTKAFTSNQVAEYFNNRYNVNLEQSASGISFSDTISKKIALELVSGDYCQSELNLTINRLHVMDSIAVSQDSIIGYVSAANGNLKQAISQLEIAHDNQKKAADQSAKDLRGSKRKTLFYKIMAPAAFVAGLILGR